MKLTGLFASILFAVSALMGGWLISGLSNSAEESYAEETKTEVKSEEKTETASETATPVKAKNTSQSRKNCIVDESAIADMQNQREELSNKVKEFEKREIDLAAREKAISEELKKIEAVRDEIKQIKATQISKNEEKVAKLVETMESMSPKAAAGIVANLDEGLAVEAMSRLSSLKLSKILAAIDPKKSSHLAEALVGVARTKDSTTTSRDVAEATLQKGGNEDANRKQSNNASSDQRKQPEPAVGGG